MPRLALPGSTYINVLVYLSGGGQGIVCLKSLLINHRKSVPCQVFHVKSHHRQDYVEDCSLCFLCVCGGIHVCVHACVHVFMSAFVCVFVCVCCSTITYIALARCKSKD